MPHDIQRAIPHSVCGQKEKPDRRWAAMLQAAASRLVPHFQQVYRGFPTLGGVSESQPQRPASFAKVMAVDGESDGQRKVGWAAEERPEQQAPVMETFATQDAKTDIGMEKRPEGFPVQCASNLRSLVLAQERADALVIRRR